MSKTPIQELMDQLLPAFALHRMAYDITWKFPEPENEARIKEARARMFQQELRIEDMVRTWVANHPAEVKDAKGESSVH